MLTVGANYVSALFIFLTMDFNNFKGQTAVVFIFVGILCLPQYFSSTTRIFFFGCSIDVASALYVLLNVVQELILSYVMSSLPTEQFLEHIATLTNQWELQFKKSIL